MILPRNTHFHFAPQKPVLTKETMGFLQDYSGCFYPKVALKTVNAYRNLMRQLLHTPGVMESEEAHYSMTHHTVEEAGATRFEIFEHFCIDDLKLAVHASDKAMRESIAQLYKQLRKEGASGGAMSAKSVSAMLTDELRSDSELWQTTYAAKNIPAATLIERLSAFTQKGPGARLICTDFRLQKEPENTELGMRLCIPGVTSHHLSVQCKFV